MRHEDLTRQQFEAIQAKVGPMLNYLYRLEQRMEKTGFLPDDELMKHVYEARDKVYRLNTALHYLSTDNMGRPPRKKT